jgi:phosphoglycerate dehydrogenase-like enzyme
MGNFKIILDMKNYTDYMSKRLIQSSKIFTFLFLCLAAPSSHGVEASEAAKVMLAELTIKESESPLSDNPLWQKPEHIVLLFTRKGMKISSEIKASLESAADGAEFSIIRDVERGREKILQADVLLGNCSDASTEMTGLKWVQYFSAGVERCLDNSVYRDEAVMLTNMKGVYGPGIAEHVIAMMFSLSRGLHRFHSEQLQGKWNRGLAGKYPLQELRGKTILIVGLGGIGSEIARRAKALGMQVMATRNSSRDKPEFVDYIGLSEELLTLAEQADVIVNATPLTPATTGLFDKAFFKVLKPSAYFINIGRGKSVVTEDLVAALKSGKLGGAGLDVVEPEPLPKTHVLWRLPNVIITPHISSRSDLVMDRFWIFVRENLRRYVNGEKILNEVNIDKGY